MAQPSNIFLNAEHESAVRTGVKTYARLKTDIRRTLRSLRDHGLALAAIKVLEAGVDLNTSLKSQAGLIEAIQARPRTILENSLVFDRN